MFWRMAEVKQHLADLPFRGVIKRWSDCTAACSGLALLRRAGGDCRSPRVTELDGFTRPGDPEVAYDRFVLKEPQARRAVHDPQLTAPGGVPPHHHLGMLRPTRIQHMIPRRRLRRRLLHVNVSGGVPPRIAGSPNSSNQPVCR